MNHSDDFTFPRNLKRRYPVAVRGEGVYLYDENGKRYLDACGGAAVVSIGHGVPEIIDAIAQQARQLSYVHSSQFASPVSAELAAVLAAKFPGAKQHVRVHYTSGGSEATETAIKIARAYWLARGETRRYKIISRWGSYHGTTLGALSASGNKERRQAFAPSPGPPSTPAGRAPAPPFSPRGRWRKSIPSSTAPTSGPVAPRSSLPSGGRFPATART